MALLSTQAFGPADGRPVLAIHGVTAHGARFRRLVEEGLPGTRAVAVDLRGHGSSLSEPPWNREQHVADLLETMDAQGLERVPVIGHSFGGLLGLCLLATAPERVERLVMIDPAMMLPPSLAAGSVAGVLADPGWASVEEARAARRAGRADSTFPDVDEDIERHLAQADDGRFRFRFERGAAICAWSEMARDLPALGEPCPTLLVAALRERYVSAEVRAALAAQLGPALETLDLDCGHMVYWEELGALSAAVAAFLDR